MVNKKKTPDLDLGKEVSHSDTSRLIFSKKQTLAEKRNPAVVLDGPTHDTKSGDLNPTALYMRQIGYQELLSPKEELRLARKIAQGCDQSRNKMIEANLRLVVKIARHYCGRGLPFMDLVEEGNLGLMVAVQKYDPSRGFRFSTYATWWIRQNIERSIMNQTRTVRLPVHIIKELNLYLRLAKHMSQKLDQAPSSDELARMVDKPVEEVEKILNLAPNASSLDSPISGDYSKVFLDTVEDESKVNPEALVEDMHMKKQIEDCIGKLEQRYAEVIVRRFGLLGYKPSTLEEVGDTIGVTRERVRQLQLEGLRRLRFMLQNSDLEKKRTR